MEDKYNDGSGTTTTCNINNSQGQNQEHAVPASVNYEHLIYSTVDRNVFQQHVDTMHLEMTTVNLLQFPSNGEVVVNQATNADGGTPNDEECSAASNSTGPPALVSGPAAMNMWNFSVESHREDHGQDHDSASAGSDSTGPPPLIPGPSQHVWSHVVHSFQLRHGSASENSMNDDDDDADTDDDDDEELDDRFVDVGADMVSLNSQRTDQIPLQFLDDSDDSDDDDDDQIPPLVPNHALNDHNLLPGGTFQFLAGPFRTSEEHAEIRFQEFLFLLRGNECMEQYQYCMESVFSPMLRHPGKAEEFIQAAMGNTSLQHLHLDISFRFPETEMMAEDWMGDLEYYGRWKKIGQGIAHLKGLKELHVIADHTMDYEDQPDIYALSIVMWWSMDGGGLQYLKKLVVTCDLLNDDDISFTRAFRNHEHLERVEFHGYFQARPMEIVAMEFSSIPTLTDLYILGTYSREYPARAFPNSLLRLAGRSSICKLKLQSCSLTEEQCGLLSETFCNTDGSKVESLNFQYSLFEGRGGVAVALSLQHSTTLKKLVLSITSLSADTCDALGAALYVNKSIEQLQFEADQVDREILWTLPKFDASWMNPIFEALQSNNKVHHLRVAEMNKWNDETADKFRSILESDVSGLKELEINSNGNASRPWLRIAPALTTNRTLITLKLLAAVGVPGTIITARMLAANSTLESFEVFPCSRNVCGLIEYSKIPNVLPEECVSARVVEALGRNITLKRLSVDTCGGHRTNNISETGWKHLCVAMKYNYGLVYCDQGYGWNPICKHFMKTIVELNAAGRSYLLTDSASRSSTCVKVLSKIANNLDAIFFHLQENASICEIQR